MSEQGWGLCIFNPNNLQPDNGASLTDYLIGLVNKGHWRKPSDWGSIGAWSWGTLHPDRFAAVMPLCGSGDPNRAYRLREVPVWAFHGELDDCVPLSGTANMVERLLQAEGKVKFTVCEGLGHDCWTDTYHREDVYEWLLAQHK